jgi:hypothetical protein
MMVRSPLISKTGALDEAITAKARLSAASERSDVRASIGQSSRRLARESPRRHGYTTDSKLNLLRGAGGSDGVSISAFAPKAPATDPKQNLL